MPDIPLSPQHTWILCLVLPALEGRRAAIVSMAPPHARLQHALPLLHALPTYNHGHNIPLLCLSSPLHLPLPCLTSCTTSHLPVPSDLYSLYTTSNSHSLIPASISPACIRGDAARRMTKTPLWRATSVTPDARNAARGGGGGRQTQTSVWLGGDAGVSVCGMAHVNARHGRHRWSW